MIAQNEWVNERVNELMNACNVCESGNKESIGANSGQCSPNEVMLAFIFYFFEIFNFEQFEYWGCVLSQKHAWFHLKTIEA